MSFSFLGTLTIKTLEEAVKHYLKSNPEVAEFLSKNNASLAIEALPDDYNHQI